MNKGAIFGAVGLGLIGLGVGGFFYIENQIKTEIDMAFAKAADNELINTLTHSPTDVDLFADTVTLSNLNFDLNLQAVIDNMNANIGDTNGEFTGTGSYTYNTVIISGIWDVFRGGKTIALIEADKASLDMEMVQTINNQGIASTFTMLGSGTMGKTLVKDLDISTLVASSQDLMAVPRASYYGIDDADFTLKMSAESDNLAQKIPPPMEIHYKIPHSYGENISPDFIAAVGAKNLEMSFTNPRPDKPNLKVKVEDVRISDTTLKDMIPIKTTYEIKGMTFDIGDVPDPKLSAMMGVMGIDEINLDMTVAYDANLDANTFALAPFKLGLKGVGVLDFNINLADMPALEDVQSLQASMMSGQTGTNPNNLDPIASQKLKAEINKQVEAIFANISLKSIAFGYKDEGILKKFIASQALQKTGGNIPALAQAYAQQAAMLVNATHGAQKAQDVMTTLVAFLTEPDKINVALSSDQPVKFVDLKTAIEVSGPMALNAFNLDVTSPAVP